MWSNSIFCAVLASWVLVVASFGDGGYYPMVQPMSHQYGMMQNYGSAQSMQSMQSVQVVQFTQETRTQMIQQILSQSGSSYDIGFEQLNTHCSSIEDIINNRNVESLIGYNSMMSSQVNVEMVQRSVYQEYNLMEFKDYFQRLLWTRGIRDESYVSVIHNNFVKYVTKLSMSGYSKRQLFGLVNYMKMYLGSVTERLSVQGRSSMSNYQMNTGYESDRRVLAFNLVKKEYPWLVSDTKHQTAINSIISKHMNVKTTNEQYLSIIRREVTKYIQVNHLHQEHHKQHTEFHESSYSTDSEYSSSEVTQTNEIQKYNDQLIKSIISSSRDESVSYEELNSYYSVLENIITNKNLETIFQYDSVSYSSMESTTIVQTYQLNEFRSYFQRLLNIRGVHDEGYVSNVYNNFVRYISKLHVSGYTEIRIRKVISYMKKYLEVHCDKPVVRNNMIISRRSNRPLNYVM